MSVNTELETLKGRLDELLLLYRAMSQKEHEFYKYASESNFDACIKLMDFDKVDMLKFLSTTSGAVSLYVMQVKLFEKSEAFYGKKFEEYLREYVNFDLLDDEPDDIPFKEGVSDVIKQAINNYKQIQAEEDSKIIIKLDYTDLNNWVKEGCLAAGLPVPDDLANYGF
jgi:hypothetical protein